jgi:hypothetical protein
MAKLTALAAFLDSAVCLDRKTARDVLQVNDLDLPRGAITEVNGPRSSGRAALLHKILAASIAEGETCALIDGSDGFDPTSATANGVSLDRIFWVRCGGRTDHAMTAADWILHAGGFGAVALDLCEIAPEPLRQIPLSWWYRFRNAIQHTRTAFVVVAGAHLTGSCAARILAMDPGRALWSNAVSGIPLANARGSEAMNLSRDRQGAVVKNYTGQGTSSLLEGIGVTLLSRKPEAAKPARYEARLAG